MLHLKINGVNSHLLKDVLQYKYPFLQTVIQIKRHMYFMIILRYFQYFVIKSYDVGAHYNQFTQWILMGTKNI